MRRPHPRISGEMNDGAMRCAYCALQRWEHFLHDEADSNRHVECIHFNPVKHGYAKAPMDWPHSSFRRHVAVGVCPAVRGVVKWYSTGSDVSEFEKECRVTLR